MKRLLYIGHAFHNRTGSSKFIQNLLAEKYDITKFDFDPYLDSQNKFEELNSKSFDVVILWQIMPQISQLKKYVHFKKIAFFPMYDGTPRLNNPIWNEYRNVNIINFSKTLHKECRHYGLSSYYIQYFPEPAEVLNWGDEKTVFLWQRCEEINPQIIEKTLNIKNIKYLYHHQVPDPEMNLIKPSEKWNDKVKVSTWFDTKKEMNEYIQNCAIYYAPRKLEGIGMSFLEAMSNGRCIIAPDYPTMNEYIKNGVNGYLYNLEHPHTINIKNLRQIQENAHKYIENGYKNWENNKYKIFDWIEAAASANSNEELMDRMLQTKTPKKISISICKKIYTKKYKIIYLLGFIPIKIKNKRMQNDNNVQ